MKVTAILATCGRHTLLERSVGMFLQQDYQGETSLLIYNNSEVPLKLGFDDDKVAIIGKISIYGEDRRIILVNNHIDEVTGERYNNLGAIYRDALTYIDEDTDTIVHWDDDDLFLPNHISEGIKGLTKGVIKFAFDGTYPCKAYKPAKSYYRHPGGLQLMSNTLEPSIFVQASHIKEHGYSLTTTDQHLQWVNPLVYGGNIFVDNEGPATLIYNWGDTDIPTFKTSGNAGSPQNFDNYRRFSQDHGDRILTPHSREQLQPYYNLVNV